MVGGVKLCERPNKSAPNILLRFFESIHIAEIAPLLKHVLIPLQLPSDLVLIPRYPSSRSYTLLRVTAQQRRTCSFTRAARARDRILLWLGVADTNTSSSMSRALSRNGPSRISRTARRFLRPCWRFPSETDGALEGRDELKRIRKRKEKNERTRDRDFAEWLQSLSEEAPQAAGCTPTGTARAVPYRLTSFCTGWKPSVRCRCEMGILYRMLHCTAPPETARRRQRGGVLKPKLCRRL